MCLGCYAALTILSFFLVILPEAHCHFHSRELVELLVVIYWFAASLNVLLPTCPYVGANKKFIQFHFIALVVALAI